MLKVLIDTSVLLDLAKDRKQQKLLRVLQQLVAMKEVSLILPRTVVDEFNRNKNKIVNDSGKSLSDVLKRTKQMVHEFGTAANKEMVVGLLDDIEFKIPGLSDSSYFTVRAIEGLFALSYIIETTDEMKLKASQRAIDKVAPFHLNKNSFNDALILETYLEVISRRKQRNVYCAFVTHNKHDFSNPTGNQKEPHPQLCKYFDKNKSAYYINLAEALQAISPELITELMVDQEDFEEAPRHLSDILAALDELFDKIWYNRHHNLLYHINKGEHQIVKSIPDGTYPSNQTLESVYKMARRAAKKVEKKYGVENLGPWDDFEWGMLNGKMSALRWVLGDEWDFLDT